MSNALRRKKKKMKPRGYGGDGEFYREIFIRKEKSERIFEKLWQSFQLGSLYVLYYDFDFSKKKIMNFNNFFIKHNSEYDAGKISVDNLSKQFKKNNFDCEKESTAVPYNTKVSMYGEKVIPKEAKLVITSCNASIESFMILSVYTLRKNYRFSFEQIRLWWARCLAFVDLYTQGLKDDHIIKYFLQECDLPLYTEQED